MDDRRRIKIIVASVTLGTVISAGLFVLRRGGASNITGTDMTSLTTNFAFALAIVFVIGVVLSKNKRNKNQ